MKEDLIDLPFFLANGFYKKTCKKCGKIFWTLNSEQEYCGDQPCVEYQFINNPISSKFESVSSVRKAFIEFFEEKDHTLIKRYPVIARWRDDVYLVGASIYDFQPWVTEGIVDPPANPLVISQPSIRLTDIDNVGRTGRHLTGFEMMAHHAFNVRGKKVYWANRTVELAFELFTEIYGIPPEELSFKFDWWSGGGNAGEDYEVLVRGLEVATLVFMHYKTVNGELVEMENKIVDTGYGLERIYWLLNGSSTIYDAVFEHVITWIAKRAGVKPLPEYLVKSLAPKMGKLDYKKQEITLKIKRMIAAEHGLSIEDIDRILSPYESIYVISDHSRSIMWIIGDGIVPSNVGAGYLARMLIRRAIRHIMRLKLDLNLADIVDKQIDTWRGDFPEYLELRDEILDVVSHEERKYAEALRHGKRVLRNLITRIKAEGRDTISEREMITLYESHGVTPDIVAEEASKEGLKLGITTDFYSKLVSKQHKEVRQALENSILTLKDRVKKFSPTEKLYYSSPRLFSFEGCVLGILDENLVILDKTAFYPEGGGQPADIGFLEWEKGTCKVTHVFKVGEVILHRCEGNLPPVGAKVKGLIDDKRRLALMRNHTATHIILGAARKVLGKHVWQAGAQKGVDQSRLDVTHHKKVTKEEIEKIEELANSVVMENRPVKKFFMNRTEAEMKYGFTIYQGGVVPEPTLRIVEIPAWDIEACGGLHCDYTGEVGIIKIVKVERLQEGISRFVFKVGHAALKNYQELDSLLNRISRILKTEPSKLEEKVSLLLKDYERLRREFEKMSYKELETLSKDILTRSLNINGYKLVVESLDIDDPQRLRDIAIIASRRNPKTAILLVGKNGLYVLKLGELLVSKGLDARDISKQLLSLFGGKGGGVRDLVQGKLKDVYIEKLRQGLKNILLRNLKDF